MQRESTPRPSTRQVRTDRFLEWSPPFSPPRGRGGRGGVRPTLYTFCSRTQAGNGVCPKCVNRRCDPLLSTRSPLDHWTSRRGRVVSSFFIFRLWGYDSRTRLRNHGSSAADSQRGLRARAGRTFWRRRSDTGQQHHPHPPSRRPARTRQRRNGVRSSQFTFWSRLCASLGSRSPQAEATARRPTGRTRSAASSLIHLPRQNRK